MNDVMTKLHGCVQALVATGTASLGYMDLLRMLTGPVYAQSSALAHKQSYYSIAKCVAALTRACPKEAPAVVGQFIQDVKNSRSTDSIRLLALLALGEVGHHLDLSGQPELKAVILDAFGSTSEEVSSSLYCPIHVAVCVHLTRVVGHFSMSELHIHMY